MSHIATSIEAACRGYGFAWLPEARMRNELATGKLALLPMAQGSQRHVDLYLVMADPDLAGPGVRRLAEILRDGSHGLMTTQGPCSRHTP